MVDPAVQARERMRPIAERLAVTANAEFIEPLLDSLELARKCGHEEVLEDAETFWRSHPRSGVAAFIRWWVEGVEPRRDG